MSEPIDRILLPRFAPLAIAAEVTRFGSLDVETGGFMLASEADPMRVTGVAFAGETGITRGRGLFHVSGKAIDRLFGWAEGQQLRIPAQFHSHGKDAFLSETDRREGFNVTDFICAVVPQYVDPPQDSAAWGWWIFDGNEWTPIGPPDLLINEVRIVQFDEDGVRGL